jgi:flavodoxin I
MIESENNRRSVMKALLVYDSKYGNTEKIARSIGDAIKGDVKVMKVNEVKASDLESLDILITGSPTQAGRPTPAIMNFLKTLPTASTKGLKAAAFDTRMPGTLVKVFGFAAGKIASELKAKGANVLNSEGFFVKGKEASLLEGELERAASWGKGLVEAK